MNTQTTHKSVLTAEMLEGLDLAPGKVYVDCTFGAGGHSRAILEREPGAQVIALDLDMSTIERFAPALEEDFGERFSVHWANFTKLYHILKKLGIKQVDGIVADFGTSQYQIFERPGFAIRVDTPLDMRLSPAHGPITAADILRTYGERELAEIFFKYGEEKEARRIARAICTERDKRKIMTTKELAEIVVNAVRAYKYPKKPLRIHPATKVFQALRIYVNKELENIRLFLPGAISLLKQGGRLVCISFHSLEDRIVKHFMRENEDTLTILTKKAIVAGEDELAQNPSARSAKLRIAERK